MSKALSSAKSAALRELAEFNPSPPAVPPREDVAFVPMAAVSEAGEVNAEHLTASEVKAGYSYMRSGDVIVAKITPCFENNKIALASFGPSHGFGSTEFHVIRVDHRKLIPKYLVHFLRQDGIRKAGERRMTGSAGQRRVPRQFLEDLLVPLPPLNEQQRIAAILDQADNLRRKRREALGRLDALCSALFESMFGDPVRNEMNWPSQSLDSIVCQIDGGWSPVCLDRPAAENEWGVLKLSAVTRCEYDDTEQKALPPEEEPKQNLEVKGGDILFTRKNTRDLVAACAIVSQTRPTLMISDLIFRIRLRDNSPIDPIYFHGLLTRPSKRRAIQGLAGGSAGSMPNISKEKLRSVGIELPPLDLQRAFAARVADIDKLKAHHRAHLAKLDALFASLQHRAFRGELYRDADEILRANCLVGSGAQAGFFGDAVYDAALMAAPQAKNCQGQVMRIDFDWDPAKAASNLVKHGVAFDDAMTVFRDPLTLSMLDPDSRAEERWITLGLAATGNLLLVVHTWSEIAADRVAVRIISARRPTRKETRQYHEGIPP